MLPNNANVGSERCESFRGGYNREVDNRGLGAVVKMVAVAEVS